MISQSYLLEQLQRILKQVIIKLIIDMQHKMQRNLLGIHNLLQFHCKPFHITILILILHYHRRIIPRNEILSLIGTVPFLTGYYRFSLVTDVVDWGLDHVAVLELEGTEHREWAKVEVVYQVVVVLDVEEELYLPYCAFIKVYDEVVVDDTRGTLSFQLSFVSCAYSEKLTFMALPDVGYC